MNFASTPNLFPAKLISFHFRGSTPNILARQIYLVYSTSVCTLIYCTLQCTCKCIWTGLGWGMLIVSGVASVYCIMYMSWSLFYLLHCFQNPLPWQTCEAMGNPFGCHNSDHNVFSSFCAFSHTCISLKYCSIIWEFSSSQALSIPFHIDNRCYSNSWRNILVVSAF